MKKLPVILLLLASLACGLSGTSLTAPPTAQGVVPPFPASSTTEFISPTQAFASETPSPSQTPASAGDPYSFPPITFVLPPRLAVRADARAWPGPTVDGADMVAPYVNPSAGIPAHLKITFGGYLLQREAYLAVFKSDDFAGNGEFEKQIITDLKSLQAAPAAAVPDGLLIGHFTAQTQALRFKNGMGVRYLAEFDDGIVPISNEGIFYYFLGLTDDGTKFIEAVLGVNAAFLPLNSGSFSPLPAAGIPFPPFANPGVNVTVADLQAYFQAVKDKVNGTPPEGFTPSLTTLDTLIQSISIQGSS